VRHHQRPALISSVKVPDLIEKHTVRRCHLKALGLEEGTITYIPNLGKDMVFDMRYKGRSIKAGEKVLKASKIDLVLGDGKASYEEDINDSIINTTEELPNEQ
jgi:hypothetical protein